MFTRVHVFIHLRQTQTQINLKNKNIVLNLLFHFHSIKQLTNNSCIHIGIPRYDNRCLFNL